MQVNQLNWRAKFFLPHLFILSSSQNNFYQKRLREVGFSRKGKKNRTRSNPVFGFEQDDGVASDDDHPDDGSLSALGELDRLVQHQVHERVEASEDALNGPAAVDLQMDLEKSISDGFQGWANM